MINILYSILIRDHNTKQYIKYFKENKMSVLPNKGDYIAISSKNEYYTELKIMKVIYYEKDIVELLLIINKEFRNRREVDDFLIDLGFKAAEADSN